MDEKETIKIYRALKPIFSLSQGQIDPGMVFQADYSREINHDVARPGEKPKMLTETEEEWLLREGFVEIIEEEPDGHEDSRA